MKWKPTWNENSRLCQKEQVAKFISLLSPYTPVVLKLQLLEPVRRKLQRKLQGVCVASPKPEESNSSEITGENPAGHTLSHAGSEVNISEDDRSDVEAGEYRGDETT